MSFGKILKWGSSALRVLVAKARLGSRLKVANGDKPVYLGRGVRLLAGGGGTIELGQGCYIEDRSRLESVSGGCLVVGEYAYLNTNCRIAAAERVEIGPYAMFGPNVCVYDHDHVFDSEGVRSDVLTSPVSIGERCWIASNALVTRGVTIGDRILVGGGSVVTRSLTEPGIYAGVPARLVRSTRAGLGGAGYDAGEAEEAVEGDAAPQAQERAVPAGHQGLPGAGA